MAAQTKKVLVHGALGKMGREVVRALAGAADLELVGGVDAAATSDRLPLPGASGDLPLAREPAPALERAAPDVVVDFTQAEAGLEAARVCAGAGVNLVSGTTGWSDDALEAVRRLAEERGIGVLVAPNFALGAVLLVHLAGLVGRFFDYAEVVESHHEQKIDSPSGTAISIAGALSEQGRHRFNRPLPSREPVAGARGGEYHGVGIHSTRMPGRMAHHELVLGAAGQTLSLRHDAISRECFMPGVLAGIRYVTEHAGLTVGLDRVLGL